MNVQKLKARMVLQSVNGEQMAEAMGIGAATFYRRLKNGGNDFSQAEICKAIELLKMTPEDAYEIFFKDGVS